MEIVTILIGFLLFCLVLLSLPVDLSFYLEKDETLEYQAKLCLLFGFVTIDMNRDHGKAEKSVFPKKQKSGKTHLMPLFRRKAFIKRLIRLMLDLLYSCRIKELNLHCRIGLGDPSDTGRLVGILWPLLLPWKNIILKTDFQEAVFEGYCKANIRIFPILIIGTLLAFIFSPVTVRAMISSRLKQ
ncbi:DUF2953 domain-containing protein [Sulfurovum sp. TSL1]|uniref:DUF2953 domain-containing protein n=1 Tax=Sulfurovum sp. TSL1 TaxID=2826994 RepID=UPI001CC4945D|nr:DUF2953 domain-containing protein [Sulfurovum sp. TSL1]GIT97910.1 hypothetical protein TSL1_07310 [Sulfurovum sp. TSL1]